MCGIVGVAGDLDKKHVDAFNEMLVFDIVRGPHSTGVATIGWDRSCSMVKVVGSATDLFAHKQYEEATRAFSHKCLIGHNRYATVGKVNKANAHPFEFQTLVGAHNGTLEAGWRKVLGDKYETDSESLYEALDKANGDPSEVIPKLAGAWSLVWYDWTTDTINFLRNDERPMFFAHTEDNKVMFWSSEQWMLEVACKRNGIKLGKTYYTHADSWCRWKIPNRNGKFGDIDFKEVKGLESFHKAAGFSTGAPGVQKAAGPQGTGTTDKTAANKVVPFPVKKEVAENRPHPFAQGMFAKSLDLACVFPNVNDDSSESSDVKKLDMGEVRDATQQFIEATKDLEQLDRNTTHRTIKKFGNYFHGSYYRDINQNIISEAEFEKRTRNSECGSCGTQVRWGENVLFCGPDRDDFLCEECLEDDVVMSFIMDGRVA